VDLSIVESIFIIDTTKLRGSLQAKGKTKTTNLAQAMIDLLNHTGEGVFSSSIRSAVRARSAQRSFDRQDVLPRELAPMLPQSMPPVFSVSKLDSWVTCRCRMIKSHYIFRNLSIFASLLQTFDTVSDVLSADNDAAMANTQ
jgi:hypothetical protein